MRERRRRNPPKDRRLITRDLLIAAGALNVKREQRKSIEEARVARCSEKLDDKDGLSDELEAYGD